MEITSENIELKTPDVEEDIEREEEGSRDEVEVESVESEPDKTSDDNTADESVNEARWIEEVTRNLQSLTAKVERLDAWVGEQIAIQEEKRKKMEGFFAPVPNEKANSLKDVVRPEDVRKLIKKPVKL